MLAKKVLLIVLAVAVEFVSTQSTNDWNQYKQKYKLKFKSTGDEIKNWKTFLANKNFIERFNSNPINSYKLKLNSRSHFSLIEFKDKVLLNGNVTKRITAKLASFVQVNNPANSKNIGNLKVFQPRDFNWVLSGVVTPVRDQRDCGCCYAFSTCASVESAIAINTNRLVVLSPQQIIDCSQKESKNQGCDGGYADESLEYVKNNGLDEEVNYCYQNKAGTCQKSDSKKKYKISGYSEIYMDIETMIDSIINHGPLVAYISASSTHFQYYGSGVFNDTSCSKDFESLDHAITIVGYGTDSKTNQDYWLIKNSWGSDWGEDGYMRIARGSNICGIEINSFYPVI